MTQTLVKFKRLHCTAGTSDKIYEISMFQDSSGGYWVKGANGRRGATLTPRPQNDSPVGYGKALVLFNNLLDDKLRKHYNVILSEDYTTAPAKNDSSYKGVPPVKMTPPVVEKVQTDRYPQLLNPIKEEDMYLLLDDDAWMLQEKVDGRRVMALVENGKVTMTNRKGEVIPTPAEFESALSDLSDCWVDGEVVGDRYYLFDILSHNDEDYRDTPAIERLDILENALRATDCKSLAMLYTSMTSEDKTKHACTLQANEREGAVLKRKDGRYRPHRPNSGGDALKCKFWASATVQVNLHVTTKRSVSISALSEAGHRLIGKVTIPPNYEMPRVGALIEVRYLYAYPGGSLYQPIYCGERDDKTEPDTIESLKFKSKDDTTEEVEG